MDEAESAALRSVRPKSTFGSLVIAALIGAFLTIVLLYMWGAQIAQEETQLKTRADQQ